MRRTGAQLAVSLTVTFGLDEPAYQTGTVHCLAPIAKPPDAPATRRLTIAAELGSIGEPATIRWLKGLSLEYQGTAPARCAADAVATGSRAARAVTAALMRASLCTSGSNGSYDLKV